MHCRKGVGRNVKPACLAVLRDKVTEPRFEHGCAARLHCAHLFRVRVDSYDFVPCLSQTGGRHSTYITQSKYTRASHYFSLHLTGDSRLLRVLSVRPNERLSLPVHLTERLPRKRMTKL